MNWKVMILVIASLLAGMAIEARLRRQPSVAVTPLSVTSMRDIRIECLAAIFHRIPQERWQEIAKHMANSPNVCLVASFLYSGKPLPAPVENSAPVKAATEAVDNGHQS